MTHQPMTTDLPTTDPPPTPDPALLRARAIHLSKALATDAAELPAPALCPADNAQLAGRLHNLAAAARKLADVLESSTQTQTPSQP